jgi:hypothetical protein
MPMKKKNILYNILFLVICGGLLIFLLNAPPETTSPLPRDDLHKQFFPMKKKDAEKECGVCHDAGKDAPLPDDHPPKYRCLFCHKKR